VAAVSQGNIRRGLGGCKLNRSGAVATLKGGSGVYRVSS